MERWPLLYEAGDILDLADVAQQRLMSSADYEKLARDLHMAFLDADAAQHVVQNAPPIGEQKSGFDAAAVAARGFLLALGIDADPKSLIPKTRVQLGVASGVQTLSSIRS